MIFLKKKTFRMRFRMHRSLLMRIAIQKMDRSKAVCYMQAELNKKGSEVNLAIHPEEVEEIPKGLLQEYLKMLLKELLGESQKEFQEKPHKYLL